MNDEVFLWITEVAHPRATFMRLAYCPDNLRTMDSKLTAVLRSFLHDELKRVIVRETEIAATQRYSLRGRQILWKIYEFFRTNANAKHVQGMADLFRVQWINDDRMEEFLAHWNYVAEGLPCDPDVSMPGTKLQLFKEQLDKSSVLRQDLATFERMRDDDPHRNFDWLYDACQRHLQRARERKNRADLMKSQSRLHSTHDKHGSHGKRHSGSRGGSPAAAPSPGGKGRTPSPKGKGKGSSKGGTNVCFDWQKGKCTRGDSCKYEHSESAAPAPAKPRSRSPARSDTSKSKTGKGKSRGHSPGGSSRASSPGGTKYPPKYRTLMCRFWPTNSCRAGSKCTFKHEGKGGSSKPGHSSSKPASRKPKRPSGAPGVDAGTDEELDDDPYAETASEDES
jgi:hypothetical protein